MGWYDDEDTYNKEYPYGKCDCGGLLYPVRFREKERVVVNGRMTYTGRTRSAVSHMACVECPREHAVDDSFDGPWE